ncbi:shikimate kinase 1, partial [Salmonella enterica subsp. enterica serovar Kentucky]|nr:shikimate kinase 1 [Salmonella enterica subsp. enterica serovar Kentucky]
MSVEIIFDLTLAPSLKRFQFIS